MFNQAKMGAIITYQLDKYDENGTLIETKQVKEEITPEELEHLKEAQRCQLQQ